MNDRTWHLLDAQKLTLGRLASHAAQLLMGKHKPGFVRHLDQGDYVIVINAQKVKVTGKKSTQKIYTSYSGYPSGLKTKTLSQLQQEQPQTIIEKAIKGMLPKNKLQSSMFNRLKVFTDNQHPYQDKINSNQIQK